MFAAPPAAAFWNDRVELFASENITYDSNVFRLPDGVTPEGQNGRSDRFNTHTLGVNLDIPVSLQRFQATYAKFWTRYQRFDHLDFDGHNASARWAWVLTDPKLDGDVGYSETTGLASFATFGGTDRDVIKTRQAFASANWTLTPRWIAYAGLLGTERTHEDPARRVHDIESKSLELRMSYLTPADNRIGFSVRGEDGNAPSEREVGGVIFDNSYRHYSVGVVGKWRLTGHSIVDGRFDYVRRDYEHFNERDYSGPAWGVTHTWTPTAKLTFLTTLRRDIQPLDDIQTASVTATSASIRPRWEITPKFALVGNADYARWKYKDPLRDDYHHDIHSFGLGFAWAPWQRVVITGNAQHEERKSSRGDADYKTTVYTLDARVGF